MSDSTWRNEPNIPNTVGSFRECHLFVYNGKIFAVDSNSGAVQCFDADNNVWTEKPTISTGYNTYANTTVSDGKLYQIGGSKKKTIIYDFLTGITTEGTPMPENIKIGSTASHDGKIYIAGGIKDNYSNTNDLYIYDIQSDSWVKGSPMQEQRQCAVTALLGSKIYVFGGYAGTPTKYRKTAEVYDIATGMWAFISELPTTVSTAPAVCWDNSIYMFGGSIAAGHQDTTVIYHLDSNNYSYGVSMPTKRNFSGAAILGKRVYVAGGQLEENWNTMISLGLGDEEEPGPGPDPDPGSGDCNSCCKPHVNITITNCTKLLAQDLFDVCENHGVCYGGCNAE